MARASCLLTMLLLTAAGCVRPKEEAPRYQSVATDPNRDTDRAKRLNQRGVELMEKGQLDPARKQFEEALTADAFFGPAHNNLGNVHCLQKDFYRAARELEMAAKLMPEQAKPRYNLATVFESVGKLSEAKASYEEARALDAKDVSIAGGLARVRIRLGLRDRTTRDLLAEVIARDVRPEWIRWARQEIQQIPAGEAATAPASRPRPRGAGGPSPRTPVPVADRAVQIE